MSEDAASKTEEPTPRKLSEARKKGDVPKTPDLSPFAVLAGVSATVLFLGEWLARSLTLNLLPYVAHPHEISVDGQGGVGIIRHAVMAAAPVLAVVFGVATVCGVAGNISQTGLMFSGEKLKPDLAKLSPLKGLKKMLGPDGLMQFFKSVVKVCVMGLLAWWILEPHASELANLAARDPMAILPFAVEILKRLLFAVCAMSLAIAGVDWLWQRQRFMKRMRMSKEEVKEDHKQSEGDPHVKARQKQIQFTRARQRMMAAVPEATVVIMNPTHYAVALKYEAEKGGAPLCVAKGLDSLALKIRAVAEEAGVTVIEDPPLARALYAAVEVDDMIPPAHYEAVAKIIGFILNAASARRATAKPL
ncbi:flagellar biosynthesis protein FlhB [Phenylobacterium sp. J426]|nr:flagellar biosynthesis protein FlhB [Phenylobacterium sp. J426]MCR5874921.1 flagellar biosynthesis protein FlhB [Phenylobacterium sp. J426]